MIKLLLGQPGSGKTKDMIKRANEAVKSAKGHIVFIDESDEAMAGYQSRYQIHQYFRVSS